MKQWKGKSMVNEEYDVELDDTEYDETSSFSVLLKYSISLRETTLIQGASSQFIASQNKSCISWPADELNAQPFRCVEILLSQLFELYAPDIEFYRQAKMESQKTWPVISLVFCCCSTSSTSETSSSSSSYSVSSSSSRGNWRKRGIVSGLSL